MMEPNSSDAFDEIYEAKFPKTRNIFRHSAKKPDGRNLYLYSWEPVPDNIVATSPIHEKLRPSSHLRWHPWREEWIAYASHRQNRTFLPPPQYNPLAPSTSSDFPTELPVGEYDVAVFENLFPSLLTATPHTPVPDIYVPTMAGDGACEVIVFTKEPKASRIKLL